MNCRPARNCGPCGDCPQTPAPVLPRCDNLLTNGVFANATVTIEEGCITNVIAGDAPLYTPDPCCATPGGGEGGDGLDGPQGPPGAAATVAAGAVTTVPFGSPATVTNVGTAAAAIFNFEIPRGPAGADAPPASGLNYDNSNIVITNGLVQELPLSWPPIHTINFTPGPVPPDKVTLTFTKSPDGTVGVTVDTTVLEAQLAADIADAIAGFQTQIDAQGALIAALQGQDAVHDAQIVALNTLVSAQATQITALETQVADLQTQVDACCP